VGTIRNLFSDPTASHLLITTSLGENYYLHSQSKTPKHLSRLKGVSITSVAWNSSQPTASTREILLGSADGNVYETFIEPQPEFYRREEKYLKNVFKTKEGPVVGMWVDTLGKGTTRRILLATPSRLMQWVGKIGQHTHEGSASIYSRLFEGESPVVHEIATGSILTPSLLAVSPEPQETAPGEPGADRAFAWLCADGVLHGKLLTSPETSELGNKMFAESKILKRSQIPPSLAPNGRPKLVQEPTASAILTQWHIIQFVDGRIVATNRLDDTIVLDQLVLEPGQTALGLFADPKKDTFWLVTADELFEIRAEEETRDVWKILLKAQQFDAASQFAKTPEQKDAVATASGDYLVNKQQFMEAAAVYGRSTKPFEQVALTFIDNGEQDALRKYLLTRLSTLKKAAVMQRMMVAAWLTELFMAKLNMLDDTITTKAELAEGMNTAESKDKLSAVREEFHEFTKKYKTDLDVKTTYEIISSHGREEELLFFATVADDYNYVLSYWIQRERWEESLAVLKKQTDPSIFYRYSSVLMANVPAELVDILMRQSNLDPQRLIPALLNYNKIVTAQAPTTQPNQAIRYLNFVINNLASFDPSIHNTLISILAASPSPDESALLIYLRTQSYLPEPCYDADFALRLCIQHRRVQSCVHIYTSMSQFSRAVDLALKHNAVDLASQTADQSTADPALRKKLWLKIAKVVIANSPGNVKTAIEFLKRCELLRIEDLIPFFPDFVVIDDFKEEICAALEEYSRSIDALKREMDEATLTAANIKQEIQALDRRYAIVEPGERCWICRLPLLMKQFFVFPCQHAFHSECLGTRVIELAGAAKSTRIRELQAEVQKLGGKAREAKVRELDAVVAGGW
jgi:vacuolar protein sorting-associated protein 18